MNETKLLENLKTLQDLKFEIYNHCSDSIDYHNFDILTLNLPNQTIDLASVYKKYGEDHTVEEIADLVVDEYEL